jgi:hypothetical protein
MTDSLLDIRQAWLDAALQLWSEPVRDISPRHDDDRERIGDIWRALGWEWFIDSRGADGYDEAPESWCGAGQAYIATQMIEGIRLHPTIAQEVMPGTDRLYDASRWPDEAPRPDGSIDDVAPGVIATVGDGPDGSHIVLVRDIVDDRYTTIECNGTGILGDGHYGEGVVRRFGADGVEDASGGTHTVRSRPLDGIKQVYPFDKRHFITPDGVS